MGYPMSYHRMVNRNNLYGNYSDPATPAPTPNRFIAGDLRRVETDQRDEAHLRAYARIAGITVEQAKKVLDAFLGDHSEYKEFGEEMMFHWLDEDPTRKETKIGQFYKEIRKEIYGDAVPQ